MRVAQSRERPLRALAFVGGIREPADERVERLQVIRGVGRPQPMVERMLAQRALRAIDRGEHVVEQQVIPGAVVQRLDLGVFRQPRAMRGGDVFHPMFARRGVAPPFGETAHEVTLRRLSPSRAASVHSFTPPPAVSPGAAVMTVWKPRFL